MEERKTAAIVLPIVVLILLYFFWYRPYRALHSTHTLSYKTCSVEFNYRYAIDTAEDAYVVAESQLTMCLCSLYIKKPDSIIGNKIMQFYKLHGQNPSPDSIHRKQYDNLDSVLKYSDKAIDVHYMWDD